MKKKVMIKILPWIAGVLIGSASVTTYNDYFSPQVISQSVQEESPFRLNKEAVKRADYESEFQSLSNLTELSGPNPQGEEWDLLENQVLFPTVDTEGKSFIGDYLMEGIGNRKKVNLRMFDVYNSGYGNGFVVSNKGHVITNYHVVDDFLVRGDSIYTFVMGSNLQSGRIENVLAYSKEKDVALVKTDLTNIDSRKVRLADLETIARGTMVANRALIINTEGETHIQSYFGIGTYDKYSAILDLEFISKDMSGFKGLSGSPIFTPDGRIMALQTSVIKGTGIVFSVVSSYTIQELVNTYLNEVRKAHAN